MVNHTQYYMADNIEAKKIIQEGTLGDLVMINDVRHVNYYNSTRPAWFFEKEKAGGGIFMNLGSHSVDKIQWLTNSRITKVKASVSYYGNKGDIEGSGMAFVETSSGIPATICQSGYGGVNRNETELIFTKGMMKLSTGQGLWSSEQGEYKRLDIDPMDMSFVLPFQDLIRSIENGTEPECSGILMIDEVDKSSNNQLFVSLLGMLRSKYLLRNEGRDYTFHSVILAGVHDVKNLKLKIRPDEKEKYNSGVKNSKEAVQIARKKGMLSSYPKLWSNYFRR